VGPDPSDPTQRRADGISLGLLHLYLSVCNAKWSYLNRPALVIEHSLTSGSRGSLWTPPGSTNRQDEFLMLSLAPFLFVLTTRDAPDLGEEISKWASWTVDQRPRRDERHLALPTADQLQGGLRAMIYPADYTVRD
jgi:hypothetical protein